jgi:hypothetical protein
MATDRSNGRRKPGRSVGRKGECEGRAPTVDIVRPTQPVRKNPLQGRRVFRVMKCQFAIARFTIVALPRTARRSSRCSRSPTYSLPAGHSRLDDEYGGESLPAEGRNSAGPPSTTKTWHRHQTHCERVTLVTGSLARFRASSLPGCRQHLGYNGGNYTNVMGAIGKQQRVTVRDGKRHDGEDSTRLNAYFI